MYDVQRQLARSPQQSAHTGAASPERLPQVPAQAHLEALRRVIDPWTRWRKDPADRTQEVTRHLTVLPNASLQKIRRACAEAEYTHVHMLAHGLHMETRGQYGLALCSDRDPATADLVDGDALATAVTAHDSMGTPRARPTLVSLATCDSDNAESVVTAGGSIAHALHAGGIPWVIASQFPLWLHASSVATEVLYRGLLRGDDPRWALYTLRHRLRTDFTATHDWASIVAYAVVPWDFEQQVEAFRNRQTRQRIEAKFDEAEQRMRSDEAIEGIYDVIRGDLKQWCSTPNLSPRERAERLGTSAASEKRIGDLFRSEKDEPNARQAYVQASELYKRAMEANPLDHWVVTQYLSMTAVLAPEGGTKGLATEYGNWWRAARQIAEWQLRTATGENRAWALGTLAELELLGAIYGGSDFVPEDAGARIDQLCRDLADAVGRDAFPVASTRRQFARYRMIWRRDAWSDLAKRAIDALPAAESWVGRAYLGPQG